MRPKLVDPHRFRPRTPVSPTVAFVNSIRVGKAGACGCAGAACGCQRAPGAQRLRSPKPKGRARTLGGGDAYQTPKPASTWTHLTGACRITYRTPDLACLNSVWGQVNDLPTLRPIYPPDDGDLNPDDGGGWHGETGGEKWFEQAAYLTNRQLNWVEAFRARAAEQCRARIGGREVPIEEWWALQRYPLSFVDWVNLATTTEDVITFGTPTGYTGGRPNRFRMVGWHTFPEYWYIANLRTIACIRDLRIPGGYWRPPVPRPPIPGPPCPPGCVLTSGLQPFEIEIMVMAFENQMIDMTRRLPGDLEMLVDDVLDDISVACLMRDPEREPPCAAFSRGDVEAVLPRVTIRMGDATYLRPRSEMENAARLVFRTRRRCNCG